MVPSKAEELIKEKLRHTRPEIIPTESADNKTEAQLTEAQIAALSTTTDATAAAAAAIITTQETTTQTTNPQSIGRGPTAAQAAAIAVSNVQTTSVENIVTDLQDSNTTP